MEDGVVSVTISDQGDGLSPEEQDSIFERFYRVDAARSRHTGGTGLGLSIVKHIVSNHGGEVTLWSRPGGFHLYRAAAQLEGQTTALPRRASPRPARPPLRGPQPVPEPTTHTTDATGAHEQGAPLEQNFDC